MAETTPVEEMPLGMFIAWLSVFLAVVLFGVALPVIDVRWVVPFVVFALYTRGFGTNSSMEAPSMDFKFSNTL